MRARKWLRKRADEVFLLGLFLASGGAACLYYVPTQFRRASDLAQEPQRLTLRELAERGSGGNAYVVVTDFALGTGYAWEIQQRKNAPPPTPETPGYGRAWIPLFVKGTPSTTQAEPKAAVVVLETSPTLASGAAFHRLNRTPTKEGLVVPFRERTAPPAARATLAASYPETDFDHCYVLTEYQPHEKADAPWFAVALAIGAATGLLLGLPSLVLGVMLIREKKKAAHLKVNRAN